jgi:hypothetical protein
MLFWPNDLAKSSPKLRLSSWVIIAESVDELNQMKSFAEKVIVFMYAKNAREGPRMSGKPLNMRMKYSDF